MDGAAVSMCCDCGLGFLNPVPVGEEIDRMYSDYYSRDDGIGYQDYGRGLQATPLDFLLLDALSRYGVSKGSTVLDVGCAFGARVHFFQQSGLVASGIDISSEAVEYGRKEWHLDLQVGRFQDFRSRTNFDAITMIDFVEHLADPSGWLQASRGLTHSGSLLLIVTPDFNCFHTYGERWTGYNASYEHLVFYDANSMARLLHQNGFETLEDRNLRSVLPPSVDDYGFIERNPHAGSHLRSKLRRFEPIGLGLGITRCLLNKIRWRRLTSSTRMENLLLVVARRSPPAFVDKM